MLGGFVCCFPRPRHLTPYIDAFGLLRFPFIHFLVLSDMQQKTNMANIIPVTRFDLDSLPEDARFQTWKESISVIFDVSLFPNDPWQSFSSRLTTCHFGSQLLSNAVSCRQQFTRTPKLIAQDGVDHFLVQLYRRGRNIGFCGGKPINARPGDVFLLDLGQSLETRVDDFDNLTLVVPRALLCRHLPNPERLHGRLLPRESALAKLLGEHLSSLWKNALQTTVEDAQAISEGVTALVAAYFGQLTVPENLPEVQAATAAAIRQYIARHFADPNLTPDSLATRFHVSRAQVYRLFSPFGGVAHYVRQQRLKWCFSELSQPCNRHRRIIDIALAAGFNDEAHFSRLFRQAFGVSPSEVRQGLTNAALSSDEARDLIDRSYEDWVKRLV